MKPFPTKSALSGKINDHRSQRVASQEINSSDKTIHCVTDYQRNLLQIVCFGKSYFVSCHVYLVVEPKVRLGSLVIFTGLTYKGMAHKKQIYVRNSDR